MEKLKKELENLAETLNKDLSVSTKELGKKSLEYMQKQYMENKMSSHKGNIKLKAYKKRYKNGFIISSGNDEVAIYNEFGTGIVGEGTNPLASNANYEYNVESPYKGVVPEGAIMEYIEREKVDRSDAIAALENVTTPNTWWYWSKFGQPLRHWRHTEGMKGKNMYSSLVDELNENAIRDLKSSISKTIGNYNSGR